MAIPANLETLTIEEKLQTMEFLWGELCRQAEAVASPDWHRTVLAEREAAIASGAEQFEEWDEAKRKIRDEIG